MSIHQDQKIESKDEERGIVRFLRDHPDFFERHPELLADMLLPHETGSAVSLVERQVSVLREQWDDFKKKLQQLEEQIDKLSEQRKGIESQLADPVIYSEDNKGKLTQLLRDKGELDQSLEQTEEQWMKISEELEAAEAAQT